MEEVKKIHPEYDPETGTWFVEGKKREYRSLREMAARLGPIEGYYPEGFDAPPWPPEVAKRTPVVGKASALHGAKAAVTRRRERTVHRGGTARSIDHEEVLDRWSRGQTGREIQAAMGLTNPTSAATIVAIYRGKGDPRATKRGLGGVKAVPTLQN